MLLCVAALTLIMQLWNADLTIPFAYHHSGDHFFIAAMTKALVEQGWVLHNPLLGMPYGLELYDFPLVVSLHLGVMKLIALMTPHYGLVLNIYFLLTFPLTVLTSTLVFRQFRCSFFPALAGGMLFAFLPYHFFRGEVHFFYAAYYTVPLAVLLILRVCAGESLFARSPEEDRVLRRRRYLRNAATIGLCAIVACSGIYYSIFAGFFLLIAGFYSFFRARPRTYRPLVTAGVLIGVLGLVGVVNLLPNISHMLQYGRNPEVPHRTYEGAEIYAMKVVQLLLPITGHRISALGELKGKYNRRAPLVNENDTATLGLIGSLGFVMLLLRVVGWKMQTRNASLFERLSVLNIAGVLLASIGGIGAVIALIFPHIRAYNRMSVYIALFSIFAVVLLLEQVWQKGARTTAGRWGLSAAFGLIVFGGLFDQTTPQFIPPYEQSHADFQNDADFVQHIEQLMPEGAMIFQLPYVPFPESPPRHRMPDYALFRGYLHSRTLRWSYGAIRGRQGDSWQQQLVEQPLDIMLETLVFADFQGIYVDRYGYPDHGVELETRLSLSLGPAHVSANDRLAFFPLRSFSTRLRERYGPEEWPQRRRLALYPVFAVWKDAFSIHERAASETWRWCAAQGELQLRNTSSRTRVVTIQMTVQTGYEEPSALRIQSPWFTEELQVDSHGRFFTRTFEIPPGTHMIHFRADAKPVIAPSDPRILVFRVNNFRLHAVE